MAISELSEIIRSLQPTHNPGTFAFCRLPDASVAIPAATVGWFRETEGISVILPLADAVAAGWTVDSEAAWITLNVESSLEAVGLTAAVSAALASEGISCNVVAACRHDHLFVPVERAGDAIRVLQGLSRLSVATPGFCHDGSVPGLISCRAFVARS